MRFYDWLPVFGDPSFRGVCPTEKADQITVMGMIKQKYPELRSILIHPSNETNLSAAQVRCEQQMGGINTGASDIIIPANPPFVCEMKRKDHTKSKWQSNQLDYLKACQEQGAFVCVALGWEGVMQAIEAWQEMRKAP